MIIGLIAPQQIFDSTKDVLFIVQHKEMGMLLRAGLIFLCFEHAPGADVHVEQANAHKHGRLVWNL